MSTRLKNKFIHRNRNKFTFILLQISLIYPVWNCFIVLDNLVDSLDGFTARQLFLGYLMPKQIFFSE